MREYASVDHFTGIFRALAEPTRVRILSLLLHTKEEACVCELSDGLDEPVYNVSRHLNILESAGLLTSVREGRWVYYRVASPAGAAGRYLAGLLAEVDKLAGQVATDRQRFRARLALRQNGRCVLWKVDPDLLYRRAGIRQRRDPRSALRRRKRSAVTR